MTATLVRSEIGTVGDAPGTLLLNTTDTFATITTAGYLNKVGEASGAFPKPTDFVFANYSGGSGLFTITNNAGVFTLEAGGGEVITPTILHHIATYANTSGTISEDPATAISGGNIQAGLSGTAGSLISYPGTASKGSLALTAVANTGNTATVISNSAMGQATTFSVPDPGVASAAFVLDHSAGTQTIATGNLALTAGNITATAGTITATANNIQAGSSGHAGEFISFPAAASTGSFIVEATANSGNTNVSLTNASHGQASVYSIPDCGNAVGRVLNAATATPFTTGNLIASSGTGGLTVDSAIAAANVVTTAASSLIQSGFAVKLDKGTGTEASNAVTINHQAGVITTSSLTVTAGSTYVITLSNSLIATTSVVLLQWMGGSNALANFTMSATAASGSSVITINNNDSVTSISGTIIIGFTVL